MTPKVTDASGIRILLIREIDRVGSMRALARKWKLSPAYLSDIMSGRRDPGPAVLKHFGYARHVERTVTFRKVPRE